FSFPRLEFPRVAGNGGDTVRPATDGRDVPPRAEPTIPANGGALDQVALSSAPGASVPRRQHAAQGANTTDVRGDSNNTGDRAGDRVAVEQDAQEISDSGL